MLTKLDKKEMVRYGRDSKTNNRNSVLFTFREGSFVFFGVSRCGHGDVFNRELGLEIAKGRALKAQVRQATVNANLATEFTRDTLAGFVSVAEVPTLLNWFRALNS